MLEGSYERWNYPHNCTVVNGVDQPDCYVTVIGGNGSTPVVTSGNLYDQDADVRLAVRVLDPRIYIGVGYIWTANNYGYPNMSSVGFGGEKLPDLNHNLSFFGSVWYYPTVKGTANVQLPNQFPSTGFHSASLPLQYNLLKYQIGLTASFGTAPVFVEVGWLGDGWSNKTNAPINRSYSGPFAGLGLRFLYP
jgi:hypothetical protein